MNEDRFLLLFYLDDGVGVGRKRWLHPADWDLQITAIYRSLSSAASAETSPAKNLNQQNSVDYEEQKPKTKSSVADILLHNSRGVTTQRGFLDNIPLRTRGIHYSITASNHFIHILS
jgi:hypothetical protein